MGVTAHYAVKNVKHLELRSELVAFRHLQGSHTGVNIGKTFLEIIKEIRCLNKVCILARNFEIVLVCRLYSFQAWNDNHGQCI
jgi:hypothetical protein